MSISNSERALAAWRRFVALLLILIATGILGLFLFVAVADPYDSLAFSPPWKRYRVTGNERYAFPGMIRHGNFDGAVFGTSTVMLLDPDRLDRVLGGHFGNFGMGSATAWEQAQLLRFLSEHSRITPRILVVGLDIAWCSPLSPAPKLTFRPFPPWEYDDDPWNDYAHLLNSRVVGHSLRQVLTMAGLVPPSFRDDGYFQFVPDDGLYDPARAAAMIHDSGDGRKVPITDFPEASEQPAGWTFPDLALLAGSLDHFPPTTQKLLMFVPYNIAKFSSPAEWDQFGQCKKAVTELARSRANTMVIDFMRPTPLTRDDTAYWDVRHYRIGPAADIVDALGKAVAEGEDEGQLFKVLWRSDRAIPPTGLVAPH